MIYSNIYPSLHAMRIFSEMSIVFESSLSCRYNFSSQSSFKLGERRKSYIRPNLKTRNDIMEKNALPIRNDALRYRVIVRYIERCKIYPFFYNSSSHLCWLLKYLSRGSKINKNFSTNTFEP